MDDRRTNPSTLKGVGAEQEIFALGQIS